MEASIIVVGVADTPTAEEAVRQAAELARRLGASLHMVSATKQRGVTTVGSAQEKFMFGSVDLAQQHQAAVRVTLGNDLTVTKAVIDGSAPGKAICAEAERLNAEIIVVGSVGTRGVTSFLGSIASNVMKNTPCAANLLVVFLIL